MFLVRKQLWEMRTQNCRDQNVSKLFFGIFVLLASISFSLHSVLAAGLALAFSKNQFSQLLYVMNIFLFLSVAVVVSSSDRLRAVYDLRLSMEDRKGHLLLGVWYLWDKLWWVQNHVLQDVSMWFLRSHPSDSRCTSRNLCSNLYKIWCFRSTSVAGSQPAWQRDTLFVCCRIAILHQSAAFTNIDSVSTFWTEFSIYGRDRFVNLRLSCRVWCDHFN